jgi:hypothetical protein
VRTDGTVPELHRYLKERKDDKKKERKKEQLNERRNEGKCRKE